MDSSKAPVERSQYLGLFIAGEEYAVGILRVKEILQYDAITRVHGAPPSIRGVINVRGSVVPVIDLAVKFGLAETSVTKRTCIVIVEVQFGDGGTIVGVLAESVTQVVDLSPEDIQPPPSFGTPIHVDYLLGMAPSGRKFVLILDIDKVLSAEDLSAAEALPRVPEAPAAAVEAVEAAQAG
jgi:purine-binding chemotaxis protein CheW